MEKRLKIVWPFATVFLCFFKLYSQSECVLKKDQDSIRVFSCSSDRSGFKSIKASFEMNTTAVELAAMILDIEGYDEWQYKTVNPHILKRLSENELIYYVEIVSPWPANNRDLVVHLKVEQQAATKSLTFNFRGIPDYIPEKDGLTRVPKSSTLFNVEVLSPSRLRVEYSTIVDPGGLVSPWMMNMVSDQGPYQSFYNLKRKIRDRNYTRRDVPFIRQ